MAIGVEELAEQLAVDPGDIAVVVASMADTHYDDLEDSVAAEVRAILNPHGERTVPSFYGSVGDDESPDGV